MAIEYEDLSEIYGDEGYLITDSRSYANDFFYKSIAYIIGGSILIGILTLAIGPYGAIIGVFIQLFILYKILVDLFKKIELLIENRIWRRERQILNSLEEE